MIRNGRKTLALVALPAWLGAAQVNFGGQSEAFPLLNKGVGARALSMGSAFEAVADDSTGAVYNPAAPGFSTSMGLGIHHEALLAGTSHEHLSFDAPLGIWGGFALQGAWVSYPSIALRDSQGNMLGNYQSSDQALGITWAKAWTPEISLGFSGRGMREDIPGAAYLGAALGAGALWKASPGLNLAAVLQSLPQSSSSSGQALRYALGGAWHADSLLSGPLTMAFSMRLDPSSPALVNVGLEKGFESVFGLCLRAGYSSYFPSYSLGALSGLSLGTGFNISSLEFDYAWIPMGDFGSTQQFSLAWKFDAGGDKKPVPVPAVAAPLTSTASPVWPQQVMTASAPAAPITAPQPEKLVYHVLSDGYVKARALEQSGQDLPAVRAYVQALKDDPKDLASWKALGALYQRLGKPEWARRCFDEAARLDTRP